VTSSDALLCCLLCCFCRSVLCLELVFGSHAQAQALTLIRVV
jgi:hypothetical protein